MNLRIAARHFDITDDVKQHAEDRLLPLKRFYDNIIDVDLVISAEKNRYSAEVTFHLNNGPVTARSESAKGDAFEAIDSITEKIEKQLKKRHDLTKLHKGPDHQTRESALNENE